MVHLIVQASKYLMIILFMIYTFECFHVFKYEGSKNKSIFMECREEYYLSSILMHFLCCI